MQNAEPYNYVEHYGKVAAQLRAEAAAGKAPASACERAASYIEKRIADPAAVRAFAEFAKAHTAEQQMGERIKAAGHMSFSAEPCPEGQRVRVELNGAVAADEAQKFLDLAGGVYDILFPGQLQQKQTNVRATPRVQTFTATNEAAALFEGWQLNKQRGRN